MEIQDVRFWAKVSKEADHWLWTGSHNSDGYGHLGRNGRQFGAHRYAWELATGETLTRSDTICHVCDITDCVRNDDEGTYRVGRNVYPRRGHLYKATQPANVTDRDTKGRGRWATGDRHGTRLHPETLRRGEQHAHAMLNDEAIRQIRATYTGRHGELAALARHFKTTIQNIRAIVSGEAWAHVTGTAKPLKLAVRGEWGSVHERCAECGLTERPHQSHGLCDRCIGRIRAREKYAANRAKGLTSQGKPRNT